MSDNTDTDRTDTEKSSPFSEPVPYADDPHDLKKDLAAEGDEATLEKVALEKAGVSEADEELDAYLEAFTEAFPDATDADAYQAALLEQINENLLALRDDTEAADSPFTL